MPVPVSELQQVAPSAVIELFELQLNALQHGASDTFRFHAGTSLNASGELVWAGNSYLRFPVEADGFEYAGNGQLPRPKLRASNIMGTITALLLTLPNGLEGAKFTRIRTLARYLDAVNFPGNVNPYGTPDPTAEFPREIFFIDRKTAEGRDAVEFEMCAAFDLAGVRAPKRQCIANICQWKYRSAECGYTGTAYFDANDKAVPSSTADVCGKRLSSCELRFGEVKRLGNVSLGSNLLTMDEPFGANVGDPVRGFGLPAGTTVVSYSGNVVTLSANATATSTITRTGTLQTNLTQIVVSSATGLATGMVVTGPFISPGTTIISIAGTTVTLGQPADLWSVATVAATRTTNLVNTSLANVFTNTSVSNRTDYINISGLSVGMYVTGPTIPASARATIQGIYGGYTASYSLAPSYLVLSYSGRVMGSEGTYTFYSVPAQSVQTYTFSAASRNYVFRPGGELPYGSFPGIGSYFT